MFKSYSVSTTKEYRAEKNIFLQDSSNSALETTEPLHTLLILDQLRRQGDELKEVMHVSSFPCRPERGDRPHH